MTPTSARTRIGAVSYLNTLPLVHGFERGLGAERVALSYAVPSTLAEQLGRGELDVALLPIIELGRIPDLELVPGLGIVTHGPSRSVLLLSRRPLEDVSSIALDPESRTSNALVQVLLSEICVSRPECVTGEPDLARALSRCDAAVRIGDKALFQPVPAGASVHDLGTMWTRRTGLPFVFAAWIARVGGVDRDLYRLLHRSRRMGSVATDEIAAAYRFEGRPYPDVAREYLTRNIRYRLGGDEVRAIEMFLDAAHSLDLIGPPPAIRLSLQRSTDCHEVAAKRATERGT